MKNSTRSTVQVLTATDIEAGLVDARWGGYGYLGERCRQGQSAQNRGDAILLEQANKLGWTADQLFAFLDSRVGRHFGDLVFGGWPDEEVARQIVRDASWYFGGF